MGELAAQGLAILMISSELPEMLGMSDRIAVMRGGTAGRDVRRATPPRAERVMAAGLRHGRVMRRQPAPRRGASGRPPLALLGLLALARARRRRRSSPPPICAIVVMQQRAVQVDRHWHDARDAHGPGRRLGRRLVRRLRASRSALLAKAGVPVPLAASRAVLLGARIGLVNGAARRRPRPAVDCRHAGDAGRRCATACAGPPRARGCAICRPRSSGSASDRPRGDARDRRAPRSSLIALARAGCCGTSRRAAPSTPSGSDAESARLAGLPPRRVVDRGVRRCAACSTGLAAVLNAVRFARSARQRRRRARAEGHRRRDRRRRGSHGRPRHRSPGTVLGVALLGAIGTGLTFLGCERLLGARRPGRDHPGGDPLGARCSSRADVSAIALTRASGRAELVARRDLLLVAESRSSRRPRRISRPPPTPPRSCGSASRSGCWRSR